MNRKNRRAWLKNNKQQVVGRCGKHGRIMLHDGKCKECRNEEVKGQDVPLTP